MRLSARNVIKGRIASIKKGATTSHVVLTAGDATITAAITNEAVAALKLKRGQPAYAVIKASDVMIGVD